MTREELFNDLIDDYQGKDRYLRDIVDDIFDIFGAKLKERDVLLDKMNEEMISLRKELQERDSRIKLEGYEYPENFPALITNGTYMFVKVTSKEGWLAEDHNSWGLATKAELMSLYYKEK